MLAPRQIVALRQQVRSRVAAVALVRALQTRSEMAANPDLSVVYRHVRAGWSPKGPGLWQRGDEVILRRKSGVWYWYPDGLGGKRPIGPFMSMSGARRRAVRRG